VVYAANGYATGIQSLKEPGRQRPAKVVRSTVKDYMEDLDKAFTYTENIFSEIGDNELEQYDNALKIKTGWGQLYDIEQMMEHAIVHVMRHKRQIERLLQTI
jgi:hypothetical protein